MSKEELELRPDQISALSFFMKHPRCADLSDPGTGKTPPACVYMYWMWLELKMRTTWAMPKSLLEKNVEELLDWTPLKEDDIVILDGTPKDRKRILDNSDAKVWLMGFKRFADDWQNLRAAHPDMKALVVDEIHMGFKGHDSKRTVEFMRAMNEYERFLAMTGTLIDGPLDSAYPTIKVIEPKYYFNHQMFMFQHAVYDMDGKVSGWQNHWKLAEIFKRHSIRRTFKEIYGDTVIVPILRVVDMDPKQRKAYDEFHENAILELEDGFMEGSEGVASIRANQIMAHPENIRLPSEWDDEGQPIAWKSHSVVPPGTVTGKDAQLLIDAEDATRKGEALIVFCAYQPEQERLVALLNKHGRKAALINGNVHSRIRGEIDRQFREGVLDTVVASQETAAVGYNWGHVHHIIMVSLDYKNTNWTQAIRRAIRGVRTKPLRISLYKYRASLDHRKFMIIDAKSRDAHLVDSTQEPLNLTTWGHKGNIFTLEGMPSQ